MKSEEKKKDEITTTDREIIVGNLIEKLRQNLDKLLRTEDVSLPQARPPKSAGVYMLLFEEELQYIGYSGNLSKRIRGDLLSGDRKSHTLINKLHKLRRWGVSVVVRWLKDNARAKFISTDTEYDARILEDFLIAIYHPYFNTASKTH